MGKTAVITGATSGIGLETAKQLLGAGYFVIGTGRNAKKCAETEKNLSGIYGGNVKYFTADLSEMRCVKNLADEITGFLKASEIYSLDIQINNAGAYTSAYKESAEGIETQFAVNYLAVFLLSALLLPQLKKSDNARILSVSSKSHYLSKIKWNDINLKRLYFGLSAYKQSKLAVAMFTNELNKRYRSGKFCAYTVDPGLVNTDIGQKSTSGITKLFWSLRKRHGVSAQEGANTSVYLALNSPKPLKYSYYYLCKEKRPCAYSLNKNNCRKLWEMSEKLCVNILGKIQLF